MTRARAALACAVVAALAGCARQPPPRTVDGVAYGTTRERFRERWWHFYERGVSWADGGFTAEAEADLRESLRQRATDSRRARTYGFHFVQCFAHRELGAVLLAAGRVDEAERELRLSLAQEPSAKAEYLLDRVRAARAGAAAVAPAAPSGAPARLQIASIEDAGADVVVRGTWRGMPGERLWSWTAGDGGVGEAIAVGSDGRFEARVRRGSAIEYTSAGALDGARAGQPDATVMRLLAPAAPPKEPALTVSGPGGDDVVTADRGWWRWSAAAPAGLARIAIRDGEGATAPTLRTLGVSGVRAGGMIDAPLTAGPHRLVFEAIASDGATAREVVAVVAKPEPPHDRALRATALLLPLQDPRAGAAPRVEDDLGVQTALVGDARLRLIDRRVDGWLGRELALVEAGWVAPSTAARAGHRLGARYGVVGTVSRGRGDIECWVRLVQVETGVVVASADAYAELRAPGDEDDFYAAVAARLRQAFPVLSGRVVAGGDGVALDVGRRERVPAGMRFHVIEARGDARAVVGEVEVAEVGAARSRARVVAGTAADGALAVSE